MIKLLTTPRRLCAALLAATAAMALAPQPTEAAPLDFHTADFRILNATTAAPIGNVHYDVSAGPGAEQIVTSDARYSDGQHDVERDELDTRAATPLMLGYEHIFYHPDGARFLSTKANFSTGKTECVSYDGGKPVVSRETFKFAKDTYAGAGIMLPLQAWLQQAGARAPVVMYYFVCIPGPKLVRIEALAKPLPSWAHYPGTIVRTDIRPDFGWLNYVIAPFLPEMHAWFSDTSSFPLVGGQFSRYYKGPEIIIARDQSATAQQRAAGANPRTQSMH